MPLGDVCRHLGISEATARRDLAAIAAKGHITRTRGGGLIKPGSPPGAGGKRGVGKQPAGGRGPGPLCGLEVPGKQPRGPDPMPTRTTLRDIADRSSFRP